MGSEMKNHVMLTGSISDMPVYSHKACGIPYYIITLDVMRQSGTVDRIPVMLPELIVEGYKLKHGDMIDVEGRWRSYGIYRPGKPVRCVYCVIGSDIRKIEHGDESSISNSISLEGRICTKPKYRTTPRGSEICDVQLAVTGENGKDDYIPCIAWGGLARRLRGIDIGNIIKLKGRLQSRDYPTSRDYPKSVSDVIIDTEYEVSITSLELVIPKSAAEVYGSDRRSEEVPDAPIEELELGERVYHALKRAGIISIKELEAKELETIKGIGTVSAEKITAAIKKYKSQL